MFEGHGALSLEGDHLDISYRNPDAWPSLTPKGSIKAFIFDFGDPEAGPSMQLGLNTPRADEVLDWAHSIDPVHHHGSDQFRVVPGGEWILAGRPIPAGGYAFQESGWVYQEHPGGDGPSWVALMLADRRGGQATIKMKKDRETLFEAGEAYGMPVEGKPYPHPAGDKGIAAIATTAGPCERGYRRGRIDDLGGGNGSAALTGLLGDPTVGPVVHVLKAAPGEAVVPACAYPTERLLIVAGGSCRVGATEYLAGDLRIQRADAVMDDVVSGPDGLQAVLIVADRRARPVLAAANAAAPDWMFETDKVLRDLTPVPGGARRASA